jgi:hypothetical protein
MKTKTYAIPVGKDRICILADPTNPQHRVINAYVKISELPLNLPTDVNPRAQNLESRVARQIRAGLLENSDVFHLLNRGLTLTAFGAEYDTKNQNLNLELASGFYGLVDGGHTYRTIAASIPESNSPEVETPDFLSDGYVKMQILVGVKGELLVDIARSLNTSAQVKDESLANLEGSFDWIKEILGKTSFGDKIAYRENEDDTLYPVDIREVVSLLTLFHPSFQDSETPPMLGYTSKGRCLDLFRKDPSGFQMLRPIIPDILRMYDYIHLHFATIYREIGGFKFLDEDKPKTRRSVKLAKVSGVRHIKEGFPLYYYGETAHYLFSDGWLLPVLSSLRAIVSYKTVAKWKADPFKFFDKVGKGLVQMTLERSVSLGRNPNSVGKDKAHWMSLYGHNQTRLLRMLNVDTDKEVVLS